MLTTLYRKDLWLFGIVKYILNAIESNSGPTNIYILDQHQQASRYSHFCLYERLYLSYYKG